MYLVLLDDDRSWLEWFMGQVELSLGTLAASIAVPELRAFTDDASAAAFIADNAAEVIGVVQDLSRTKGVRGPLRERIKSFDGIRFLREVLVPHIRGKRALIVTGSLPDSIITYLNENRRNVDVLHKRDVTQERLLAKVHWILQSATKSHYDEATTAPLLAALGPAWDEVCRHLTKRPDSLYSLDSRKFEELVAEMFRDAGWNVELTARTRDHGYDIVALQHGLTPMKVLVEAKRYARDAAVPVSVVRSLFGVRAKSDASKVVLATSSHVSDYAKREFTREVPWQLSFIEGQRILEWCKRKSGLYVLDQDDPTVLPLL